MATGWGTFGNANYAGLAIPKDIALQYPGASADRLALGGFGRLAYGPEAAGLGDIEAAQASDEPANAYQTGTEASGGQYGDPRAGALLYSGLLNNLFKNEALRQATTSQSTTKALQGMADTGINLANNIYGKQKADIGLEEAQNQASGEELGAFSQLLNLATSPKGLGANVMGAFQGNASPAGSLISSAPGFLSSMFSSAGPLVPNTGMPAGADILGTAGFADIADFAAL